MRPPVHELRALTAREPGWAIALRKLVDAAQSRSITPDRLIQMIDKAPRTAARTKPAPAPVAEPTVTPPLFGS
jgi:hypothetical protein